MTVDSTAQARDLLRRYYASPDPAAERALGDLLECVRPMIRRVLVRKGLGGEDLEDLCGETAARMVVALRNSRDDRSKRFDDCTGYAITIAKNLYVDHVRRAGSWRPLQLMVVKVLSSPERKNPFARWTIGAIWLGGLARWRGQPFRATTNYVTFWQDQSRFRDEALGRRDPTELRLPELMAHLFVWVDTPLDEDELVTHVAELRQMRPTTSVSLDAMADETEGGPDGRLPTSEDDPEAEVLDSLGLERLGKEVWTEVCELRPMQRAALLLGMEWSDWMKLGWTPTAVAPVLDIPPDQMLELWRALPLPDRDIAQRLGVREEQVPNLRKCARERLWRRCRASMQQAV